MMNRTEYMRAVFESDLDAEAKLLAVYLGYRKNWKDDRHAFPSIETMALETSMSRSTVNRRLALLRETKWAVPTGDTKGRGVIVYDLQIGQSDMPTALPDPGTCPADTAGGSAGDTEQVSEQVREQDREQVTTGAGAPVEERPSTVKEEWDILPPPLPNPDGIENLPGPVRLFLIDFDSSLDGTEDPELVLLARDYIVREQPRYHFNGPRWWRDEAIKKVKVAVGLEDDGW